MAWIDEKNGHLVVPEACVEEAERQLRLYHQENIGWPPVAMAGEAHPEEWYTVAALGTMAFFALVTGPWTMDNPWFQRGAVESRLVLQQGEWWRLVTGLTLHADFRHLFGNCCLGWLLVRMLSSRVGHGLAWFSIIGCGIAANWLNIAWRQQVHHSVGFSTAVFAAVGLLAGLQVLFKKKKVAKELVLALGAGLALLALLGTEGERTDLGSHLFGFLIGFALGLPLGEGRLLDWSRSGRVQGCLWTVSMATVVVCWWLAYQ